MILFRIWKKNSTQFCNQSKRKMYKSSIAVNRSNDEKQEKNALALNCNGNVYLCSLQVIKKLFVHVNMYLAWGIVYKCCCSHQWFGFSSIELWRQNFCTTFISFTFALSIVYAATKVKWMKKTWSENKLMSCRYISFHFIRQ